MSITTPGGNGIRPLSAYSACSRPTLNAELERQCLARLGETAGRATKASRAFRSGVNDATGGRGEAVVERPEGRADAQCDDFKIGSRGVMQAENLQRFFECLRGIAGWYRHERVFAEWTLG